MTANYIMLTQHISTDEYERPILVGARHIISITDTGKTRKIVLYPDRTIHVTEQWDQLQALLESEKG